MTTPEPETARTASITRVMPVPARFLFEAHSKPEHLMRWFGPEGYPVTTCTCDFRVGGHWRMIMTGPDGVDGPPFGGTYLEIIPYSRIVYTDAFEDARGGDMGLSHADNPMTFTVTFDEADGLTTMTVAVLYASIAMKEEFLGIGMMEGLTSGLDQLAGVAAELAQRG